MFTVDAKNAILKELTGVSGTAFDFNKIWMGLGSLSGGEFVELTDAVASGYLRKQVGDPSVPALQLFNAPSAGSVVNAYDIQFARSLAAWTGVEITHAALFTASTGGTQLTLDALTSSISGIGADVIVVIPAGSCTISFN